MKEVDVGRVENQSSAPVLPEQRQIPTKHATIDVIRAERPDEKNLRLADVRKRLTEAYSGEAVRAQTVRDNNPPEILEQPNRPERITDVAERMLREADPDMRVGTLALQERFEAKLNLLQIEAAINGLAKLGDDRTKAQEQELNRLIVWYRIYKQLHRDADKRMREADDRFFNKPKPAKNEPFTAPVIALGETKAGGELLPPYPIL